MDANYSLTFVNNSIEKLNAFCQSVKKSLKKETLSNRDSKSPLETPSNYYRINR